MSESFTIQIHSNLVKQLADEGEKLKKKTRKPKTTIQRDNKAAQKPISGDPDVVKGRAATGWPVQPPLFMPVPPPTHPAIAELDAIRSVLKESEKVVERLQKQEENMLQEVTKKAKDLHDKEFKLPNQKPTPCLDERDACFKCYKEHEKDPLNCANVVQNFAECARRVKHQVSLADK
ncbi:uncharacterized protein LOC132065784 [Lycium ferocissimum]|uniref:uncharacterized protein LOC132065784 n=1 Tax=Lycium ferocissimum TaxID=112874 RepID=UPI0028161E30|nr:uncharacterized protein LOC132065784 [Lycium ferocissimum]XP_059315307.1 uncharacterized protein LOC132065784 [Lycium ferocissimum]